MRCVKKQWRYIGPSTATNCLQTEKALKRSDNVSARKRGLATPLICELELISEVNHAAFRCERSFVNCFVHGRVSVDGGDEFFAGCFKAASQGELSNEFGGRFAHDVCAQDFAPRQAADELAHAIGVLGRDSFAKRRERETSDRVVFVFDLAHGFEFALGEADTGDLRMAIGATGDDAVIHGVRFVVPLLGAPADAFNAENCFFAGDVREPRWTDDIADGVDAGEIGLVINRLIGGARAGAVPAAGDEVGLDVVAPSLKTKRCIKQPIESSLDADCEQNLVSFEYFFLGLIGDSFAISADGDGGNSDLDAGCGFLNCERGGAGANFHAVLFEHTFHGDADVFIFDGEDAGHHFDDGDLGAKRLVEVAKLHADRACADNDEFLGLFFVEHRFACAPDLVVVELGKGQIACNRAGGDNDVGCSDSLACLRRRSRRRIGPLFLDLAVIQLNLAGLTVLGRRNNLGAGHDVFDLVLLHQELNTFVELGRDIARAADDLLPVKGNIAIDLEAPGLTILDFLHEFGVREQCLAGNATPVEADAAELGAFDDGDFEAHLGSADGADVTGGSAADDDDIEVTIWHLEPFKFGRRREFRRAESSSGLGGADHRDCNRRCQRKCVVARQNWLRFGSNNEYAVRDTLFKGEFRMRGFRLRQVAGLLGVAVTASVGVAQSASLVADIRTTVLGGAGQLSSTPRQGALMCGEYLYFVAADAINGNELWKTDGTVAGTQLVLDVFPGAGGGGDTQTDENSVPLFRGPGETIMFLGNGGSGIVLWQVRPDGAVSQIYPASSNDPVINVPTGGLRTPSAVIANKVYFAANTTVSNRTVHSLWVSDGTAAGTRVVFSPSSSGTSAPLIGEMAVVDSKIIFSCMDLGSGRELWASDGTTAGTTLLKDIFPGSASSSSPHSFCVFNDILYFFATPSSAMGNRFFRTDGTPNGTVEVSTNVRGNTNLEQPVVTSEGMYFISSPNGAVCRYDGVSLALISTTELARIDPPTQAMAVMEDLLYYCARGKLYRREASGSITTLLTTPGFNGTGDLFAVEASGTTPAHMFFYADNQTGVEPFVSDGTIAGTFLLSDVFPGQSNSSLPRWIGSIRGKGLFRANNSSGSSGIGTELYISDGTSAGTLLFRDIHHPTSDSNPGNLFAWNNTLYFSATTVATGLERYRLDQPNTVTLCDETVSGTASIARDLATAVNGKLFSRWQPASSPSIRVADAPEQLGVTIATSTGPSTFTGAPFVKGSDFYFSLQHPTFPSEYDTVPWRSDGTLQGTVSLAALVSGAPTRVSGWIAYRNEVYFLAKDYGENAWSVYATGGTAATTRRIVGGRSGTLSYPIPMFDLFGRLIFAAFSEQTQTELWAYEGDGTPIRAIKPVGSAGSNLYCRYPVMYDNKIVWTADFNASNDSELWITDGTDINTTRIRDILPGTIGSLPSDLIVGPSAMGSRVYFTAHDGVRGRELWITDGTHAGTQIVKDIVPGIDGSMPRSITLVDDRVYFVASDRTHGLEWWVTDGTDAGTHLVADINPGPSSSAITQPFVINGKLYFAASDEVYGKELWVIRSICMADFNGDAVVDFFDYLDFVDAFSSGNMAADFNADGVLDFFDYLDFVDAFAVGC